MRSTETPARPSRRLGTRVALVMDEIRPLASVVPLALALALGVSACQGSRVADPPMEDLIDSEALIRSEQAAGMVRVTFPDPDPGIPAYARAFPGLDQFFRDGEWLAIPFYRSPEAIPADFNLLDFFHFPGPNGPGAFGTPLLTEGFYFVEAGAPQGTFPTLSISTGDAVPFWFVKWVDYQAAMSDGIVTIGEVRAMSPLRGTARQFAETLKPRPESHLVVISARGRLADGRSFDFHVTHIGDVTRAVRIRFGR
jgi:hypothetical protein